MGCTRVAKEMSSFVSICPFCDAARPGVHSPYQSCGRGEASRSLAVAEGKALYEPDATDRGGERFIEIGKLISIKMIHNRHPRFPSETTISELFRAMNAIDVNFRKTSKTSAIRQSTTSLHTVCISISMHR
jgi:hypothetical protein